MEKQEAILELARRRARTDFQSFIKAVWPKYQFSVSGYHDKLTEQLQAIGDGESKRLALNVPPRHSKSLTVSTLFPAWYLGNHPDHEIILVSYSAELAQRFSREVRNIMQSQEYRDIFPEVALSETCRGVGLWETEQGGRFLAQGTGGSITGFGANLLICDDPVSGREDAESRAMSDKLWDFWISTARTRLAPNASTLLCSTRWAINDLHGRIMDSDGDNWDVMKFPAIDDEGNALWPEQYSVEALRETKNAIGDYEWQSLFMCEPYQRGGKYIDIERINWIAPELVPTKGMTLIRSIDLAATARKQSDFTCSVLAGRQRIDGQNHLFILDGSWVMKAEWPTIRARIAEDAKRERGYVPIYLESQAGFITAYSDLKDYLRGITRVHKVTVKSGEDKLSRSIPLVTLIDAGRLHIAKGDKRFIDEATRQFSGWPSKALHDDVIDAVTQAWKKLDTKNNSRAWIF